MSNQERGTSSYVIVKKGEKRTEPEKRAREMDWMYLTPMAAAPILPLLRIAIKDYPPKTRNIIFGSAVGFFLIHGAWLIGRAAEKNAE